MTTGPRDKLEKPATHQASSARYSSGSSAAAGSSDSKDARFASKALEMYLRKIRPSATRL